MIIKNGKFQCTMERQSEQSTKKSSGVLKTQNFHPVIHYGAISTKLWIMYK